LENFTISLVLTATHGHSDPLDRRPASPSNTAAFGLAHAVQSTPGTRRGTVLTGTSAAKRQQGPRLDLLHGTGYKLQHRDLGEGGQREVLTDEAVRVAVADGIEGENSG
jgi:hypothetical protein